METLYLHLGLYPGPNDVGLGSKLAPQPLVGLLSGHFLLEHLVSEGHKVLHLQEQIQHGHKQLISGKPNYDWAADCLFTRRCNLGPKNKAKTQNYKPNFTRWSDVCH